MASHLVNDPEVATAIDAIDARKAELRRKGALGEPTPKPKRRLRLTRYAVAFKLGDARPAQYPRNDAYFQKLIARWLIATDPKVQARRGRRARKRDHLKFEWRHSREGRLALAVFDFYMHVTITTDDHSKVARIRYADVVGTPHRSQSSRGIRDWALGGPSVDAPKSKTIEHFAPAPPWLIRAHTTTGALTIIRWTEYLSMLRAERDMALRDLDRDAKLIVRPRTIELGASFGGQCSVTVELTTRPRLSLTKRAALQKLAERRAGQRSDSSGPISERTRRRWARADRLKRPAPAPDRSPEELFRLLGVHGSTAAEFDVAGIKKSRGKMCF